MRTEFLNNPERDPDSAYLMITDAAEETALVDLVKNSKLFVGSGPNCRIVLPGSDVQNIHCMLWLDDNRDLRVQDWNTNGQTIVNDRPIEEVTLLNSGDQLRIGTYLIVPMLNAELDAQVFENVAVNDNQPSLGPSFSDRQFAPAELAPAHAEASVSEHVSTGLNIIESELAENDDFESTYVYDFDADQEEESADNYDFAAQRSFETESTDEELEMLRNEVEQLRYEVADRDSRIRLLSDRESFGESDDNEDEQTVRLVNRLEELLQELQSTDHRARGLEELLRVSDQATRAEQDERAQLESWVTEIEQRISQREAESEAEMQRNVVRLKDAEARRKHAESHLKKIMLVKNGGSADSSNELLKKMAEQIEDLQNQLAVVEEEKESLRALSVNNVRSVGAVDELHQMEQKLMQVQVDASREQAELARQRAQLERLKDELQQKLNSNRELGEADSRIQAMRQHLQDIHRQEKIEADERKQRSLGGRIANLLNRVGR